MGSANDPALVEIVLHDLGRHGQVGIALDGSGEPVDIRRLEIRDLVEPVPVELAERDDERASFVERGTRRRTEVADPTALERPGRVRGAQRFAT